MLDFQIKHTFPDSRFHMDLSLSFKCTGITVISGPSGAGKSTLLRAIAGLLKPDEGRIYFNQEVWQDKKSFIPTYQRSVAYVFQEGSLLPHLTGQDNINYGLKRSQLKHNYFIYDEVIDVLGIRDQLTQLPYQMSGGERQRMAIASAVIRGAKVLLMDEPLASLDRERKQKLISYFKDIKTKFEIPIIYVTHSIDEIHSLADRIIFMQSGKVQNQSDGINLRFDEDQYLYLDLDPKATNHYYSSASIDEVVRMTVRIDQCLLFQQRPIFTNKAVILEVVVHSINENGMQLKYHSQVFDFPTNWSVNLGQKLWLQCANPQVI